MLTMGSDFQYESAVENYLNIDKLIHYVNAKVHIFRMREQLFEVFLCLVLYCVVDKNPYQLSVPGSSVGRVLT